MISKSREPGSSSVINSAGEISGVCWEYTGWLTLKLVTVHNVYF